MDDYSFWRFTDLVERRIVTNRQDLSVKQKLHGFPKPVRLAAPGRHGVALFPAAEVKRWVDARLGRQADEPAADAGTGGQGTGDRRGHAGGDAQGRRDPVHQHRSRSET